MLRLISAAKGLRMCWREGLDLVVAGGERESGVSLLLPVRTNSQFSTAGAWGRATRVLLQP